ncbi:MAG: hypothetical protein RIS44_2693 [Pseudomonadota bacterium]
MRNFDEDEGGPLGVGEQMLASNHLKLRGLRAQVVSVEAKGGVQLRQVRRQETNASEPLMKCRKTQMMSKLSPLDRERTSAGAKLRAARVASGIEAA